MDIQFSCISEEDLCMCLCISFNCLHIVAWWRLYKWCQVELVYNCFHGGDF